MLVMLAVDCIDNYAFLYVMRILRISSLRVSHSGGSQFPILDIRPVALVAHLVSVNKRNTKYGV